MCLVTSKRTKVKITKKDITCYKLLMRTRDYQTWDIKLYSACQFFPYELNKLYTTTLTYRDFKSCSTDCYDEIAYNAYIKDETKGNLISYIEGFHSFSSIDRGPYKSFRGRVLVECTIPKGTKYVNDKTGLICSDAIIINKILEN